MESKNNIEIEKNNIQGSEQIEQSNIPRDTFDNQKQNEQDDKKSTTLRNIAIVGLLSLKFLSACMGNRIVQVNPVSTFSPQVQKQTDYLRVIYLQGFLRHLIKMVFLQ